MDDLSAGFSNVFLGASGRTLTSHKQRIPKA
jgi:hypothetical protein